MWYALVQDVAASWERYDVVAALFARHPPGLVLHVAGPTDEGFRIIEVWESEDAWRTFSSLFDAAMVAVDPDVTPRAIVRELHARHVDIGAIRPEEVVPDRLRV